jgi:hypothetical protein
MPVELQMIGVKTGVTDEDVMRPIGRIGFGCGRARTVGERRFGLRGDEKKQRTTDRARGRRAWAFGEEKGHGRWLR